MARTPADRSASSIRATLTQASAKLSAVGSPGLAEAVDAVLAPGGWELLRGTDPSRSEGTERNLAINIPETIRDQIRAAVNEDPEMESVTAAVNHGFRLFLNGSFTPAGRQGRSVDGSGARVNLNVRPSGQMRDQITQAGHSAAAVASHYLMFRYQLGPYAGGAREVLPKGAQRNPEVPRRIRDRIRELAAAAGDRVDDIVNEGFQKFLAGEFDPQPVVWSADDLADMVPLRMHPSDDLFERVKEAARKRPQGALRPAQVAIDYLLDQFSIEADRAE